ncbi:hypothetical protein, partial [Shinella sp.]|uniref:hypothetical protein n=1 Tax=Shinella sp. TaxID=1870904 RepID=UPI003F6F00B0
IAPDVERDFLNGLCHVNSPRRTGRSLSPATSIRHERPFPPLPLLPARRPHRLPPAPTSLLASRMDLFSQIAICCRVMAVGAWISVIDAPAVLAARNADGGGCALLKTC